MNECHVCILNTNEYIHTYNMHMHIYICSYTYSSGHGLNEHTSPTTAEMTKTVSDKTSTTFTSDKIDTNDTQHTY